MLRLMFLLVSVSILLFSCSQNTFQYKNAVIESNINGEILKGIDQSLVNQLPSFPPINKYPSIATFTRINSDANVYSVNGAVMISSHGLSYTNGEIDFNKEKVIIPDSANQLMVNNTNQISWASYSLDLSSDPYPVKIEVKPLEWKPDSDERIPKVYIGIGNYTNFCWEWHGPYEAPKGESTSLILNSKELRDCYLSEKGTLEYVIVATGEDGKTGAFIVDQSQTTADQASAQTTKPYFTDLDDATFQDPSSTSYIEEHSTSASTLDKSQLPNMSWRWVKSLRKDSEITKFNIYRKSFNDFKPAFIGSITPNASSVLKQSFVDSDEYIAPLVPGKMYLYYIQAENSAGKTRLSRPRTVFIPPVSYKWVTQYVSSAIDCKYLDFNYIENMPSIVWCEENIDIKRSVLKYSQLKQGVKEPTGPTDWETHTVYDNSNSFTGIHPKIIDIQGKPFIAFVDQNSGFTSIIIAYSSLAHPSKINDWSLLSIESTKSSLINIGALDFNKTSDDRPILAYQNKSNNSIKVAIGLVTIPMKPEDWVYSVVDSNGVSNSVGNSIALLIKDKSPIIAYEMSGSVKIANITQYSPTEGSILWESNYIDSVKGIGNFINLEFINDRLSTAYYDSTNADLIFSQCLVNHPIGPENWFKQQVDGQFKSDANPATKVGEYCSIIDAFNRPAIAYIDSDKNNLKFAWSYTTQPTSWVHWRFARIDSTYNTGENVVLRINNNSQHLVAVYNETNSLKNNQIKYSELVEGY